MPRPREPSGAPTMTEVSPFLSAAGAEGKRGMSGRGGGLDLGGRCLSCLKAKGCSSRGRVWWDRLPRDLELVTAEGQSPRPHPPPQTCQHSITHQSAIRSRTRGARGQRPPPQALGEGPRLRRSVA